MHKAVMILGYVGATLLLFLGIAIFTIGMFGVASFIATPFLFVGALFFIGAIVVYWRLGVARRQDRLTKQYV